MKKRILYIILSTILISLFIYIGESMYGYKKNKEYIASVHKISEKNIKRSDETEKKLVTSKLGLQKEVKSKSTDSQIINENPQLDSTFLDKDFLTKTINKMRSGEFTKIVCYGDSITYGYVPFKGGKVANTYPNDLKRRLIEINNNKNIEVFNQGTPGWQTDEGLNNINDKVLNIKPDLTIIMFGINDVRGHVRYGPVINQEDYQKNLTTMVSTIKKMGGEVLLLSPTPIYDNEKNHSELEKYVQTVRDTALSTHCAFIDLNSEIIKNYLNGSTPTQQILPDNIHFRSDKYSIISDIIIKQAFAN